MIVHILFNVGYHALSMTLQYKVMR